MDTGGLIPEDKAAMPREILRQADVAIAEATELVLVVDARAGLTPLDAELARRLRRTGKPLVVAANKVDTAGSEALAAAFYELGADVYPISAEHGTGVDDLLEAVTRIFRAPNRRRATRRPWNSPARRRRVAAQGCAKFRSPSSAAPTSASPRCSISWPARSVPSSPPIPGTTRDAVDMLVRSQRQALSLRRHGRHPPQRQDDAAGAKS